MADGIADAPNTIFTIDGRRAQEDGRRQRARHGAQRQSRRRGSSLLQAPRDRLRDFDDGGTISSEVFSPTGYRGVLIESEGGVPGTTPIEWPWPNLTIADFKEGDGTIVPAFPHHALTADDISALKIDDPQGGVQGIFVKGTDGKTYSLTLRPLLPGETE